MKTTAIRLALAAGAFVACAADAKAQPPFAFNWVNDGEGAWSEGANWLEAGGLTGPLLFDDSATIGNGGTAVIDGAASAGGVAVNNGAVDIRAGGELQVLDTADSTGSISIGASGALRFSGDGSATVDLNVVNNGVLSLTGPDAELSVTGGLTNNGTFIAGISGSNHSLVTVEGTAALGGTLSVQVAGSAPSAGDSWDLIEAAAFDGDFASIDASLSPPLERGLQYNAGVSGDRYQVSVDNALVLSVDRTSGVATISNAIGDPITFDGYSVNSSNGLLDAEGWISFHDSGVAGEGWLKAATADANGLVELNFDESQSLAVGESLEIGSAYAAGPISAGEEDVAFEYNTPDGARRGIVEYTGPINDIVLAVDPESGAAEIRNLSPYAQFAATVNGYTVASASGALNPGGWNGFEDSGAAGEGWRKGTSPTANGIAELNLEGSTAFGEGTVVSLGEIFTPGQLRDLVFQYAAIGAAAHPGDANGDGTTDLADFNILKGNFNTSGDLSMGDFNGDGVVDLADFNILKENFNTSGELGGEAEVKFGTVVFEPLGVPGAAVPEPGSLALAALAASGALVVLGRKKGVARMIASPSAIRAGAAFVVAAACLVATAAAQDNDVQFGEVGTFTGGDAGEGLDFEGLFQYAVNIRGPGGLQVGDAMFTDDSADGVSWLAENEILSWAPVASYGDTPNDDALETVMNSIRWSNYADGGATDTVQVTLENLVVGAPYRMQVLFAERCCDRAFDLYVDGELGVGVMWPYGLVNPEAVDSTQGAYYAYEFTADADSVFLELDGRVTGGGVHPDGNAILNAVTLEIDLDKPGDFNFDGAVDLLDYDTLLDNILVGDSYSEGDINLNGEINLHDFIAFKQAYQAEAAGAAVPEPGTLALLATSAVGLMVWRRRRLAA